MQAPFENLAGALFDWQGNGDLYDPQATRWFDNAGTFRKSAGSGWGYMFMPFRNTGTVQGQSGTLQFAYTCQNTGLIKAQGGSQVWFSGGGTMAGTYEAAAGSAMSWSGGTFTPGEPLLLVGPGQLSLAGATLILPADLIPGLTLASGTVVPGPAFQGGSITNLTLGSVTLAGTNTVTGTLRLTARYR